MNLEPTAAHRGEAIRMIAVVSKVSIHKSASRTNGPSVQPSNERSPFSSFRDASTKPGAFGKSSDARDPAWQVMPGEARRGVYKLATAGNGMVSSARATLDAA